MAISGKELFWNHEGNLLHKWEHYFDIYDKYFDKYRGKEVAMLEIGISHGGSIDFWHKYFGDGLKLYSMDINPECKRFEDERTKVFIGSQSDSSFLSSVIEELPDLDIIIDDGGHTMEQQKVSFEFMFSKVKQGGVYLVEDTHTSYWYEFHGGLKNKNSFIEYSKDYIDSIYEWHIQEKKKLRINENSRNINSICFYDSIVVFEKKLRERPFHKQIGNKTIQPYMDTTLKRKNYIQRKIDQFILKKTDPFWANSKDK
jgi:hypothetical protein